MITKEIENELRSKINKDYKKRNSRFFKEKVILYGVPVPIVRKIAKKHFKKIENLGKENLFKITEIFFKERYNEKATIATQWLVLYFKKNKFEVNDFPFLEKIIEKYLDNWAKIDDYCTHIISSFFLQHPQLIKKMIEKWSNSKNLWTRRASAVGLITNQKNFATTIDERSVYENIALNAADSLPAGQQLTCLGRRREYPKRCAGSTQQRHGLLFPGYGKGRCPESGRCCRR